MSRTVFSPEALAADVQFSRSPRTHLDDPRRAGSAAWLPSAIKSAAVSVAVSGVLTFSFAPTDVSEVDVFPSALHDHDEQFGLISDAIDPAVRAAAKRFLRLFVDEPPSEVDRTLSPDYDL